MVPSVANTDLPASAPASLPAASHLASQPGEATDHIASPLHAAAVAADDDVDGNSHSHTSAAPDQSSSPKGHLKYHHHHQHHHRRHRQVRFGAEPSDIPIRPPTDSASFQQLPPGGAKKSTKAGSTAAAAGTVSGGGVTKHHRRDTPAKADPTGGRSRNATTIVARSSFMPVREPLEQHDPAPAPAEAPAPAGVAAVEGRGGGGGGGARRTTSVHTGGGGDGVVVQASPSGFAAGGNKVRYDGAGAAGGGAGAGSGSAGGLAPRPVRLAPTPLQVPPGSPPLPPKRKKGGRLRRAWNRFKRMATCSSVATRDPPLHGVALTPGETAADVSREIAEEEAAAARAATSTPAAAVTTSTTTAATGPLPPTAAAAAAEPSPSPSLSPPPPRLSASGADSSECSNNHTGYLSTPLQWHRGGPRANPPASSGGYAASSAAATVSSNSTRPTDPYGPYGTSEQQAEYGGGGGTSMNGSTHELLPRRGDSAADRSGVGVDSVDGGGGGWSRRAVEGGGMVIGSGGGVGGSVGGRASAQRQAPLSLGSSIGAPTEGRASQADRLVLRGRESVSSIKSAGSGEEDWHDARSVVSTWSLMSCFSGSNHGSMQGGAAAAAAAAVAAAAAEADGATPPSLSYSARAAAEALTQAMREGQQRQQQQQLEGGDGDGDGDGDAAAAAGLGDGKQVLQAQKQAPVLPATPPLAARGQTRPADWSPPPQRDTTTTTTTTTIGLSGQLSTPVLAAPLRAASAEAEAEAGAAASPLPAATPRAAAAVAVVPGEAEAEATMAEAAEVEVEEVPVPPEVRGIAIGELPEWQRPSWVPPELIPGLDPATRFVPVPRVTGIASYWAKVPELSAPIPMPIDLALNVNRMARTAHESIRGILFRETDTEIIMKARLTLPLGVKMTHQEHYHKDNSEHTVMLRRDVRPGKTVTRMYFTADGDSLLAATAYDMSGRITHTGYELVRLIDNGDKIKCRQWVVIMASGKVVEQDFVGRRAPIPGHH